MDQTLLDKLARCRDLPTLPAAAVRIVALAEDPAATMAMLRTRWEPIQP